MLTHTVGSNGIAAFSKDDGAATMDDKLQDGWVWQDPKAGSGHNCATKSYWPGHRHTHPLHPFHQSFDKRSSTGD